MVITGPDNIAFQTSNSLGARLSWLLLGLTLLAKAALLWRANAWANEALLPWEVLIAALGVAALLQTVLGIQKTVYFNLTARTVDVFWSVFGWTSGKTFGFDQIYRIRIVPIPRRRYQPPYFLVETFLRDRADPITDERYYIQQEAADTAAQLHEAVFGAKPEPWMLEGEDLTAQPSPA